jgi:hypothetical protein
MIVHILKDDETRRVCYDAVSDVAAKREAERDWFTLDEVDELMVL